MDNMQQQPYRGSAPYGQQSQQPQRMGRGQQIPQQQQQQQQQQQPRPIFNNYQQTMSQQNMQPMIVGYSTQNANTIPQISMLPQYRQPYASVNPIQYALSPYPVQIPPQFYNVAQQVPIQQIGHHHFYAHPQQNPTPSPQQLYSGANLMATNMQQIKTTNPQQQHQQQQQQTIVQHPQHPQQSQSQTIHSQQHTQPQQLQPQTTAQAIQTIPSVPQTSSIKPPNREKRILNFVNPDTGENVILKDEPATSTSKSPPPPQSATMSKPDPPIETTPRAGGDQIFDENLIKVEEVLTEQNADTNKGARAELLEKIKQAQSEDNDGSKSIEDENQISSLEISADLDDDNKKDLYSPISNTSSLNHEDLNSPDKPKEKTLVKVPLILEENEVPSTNGNDNLINVSSSSTNIAAIGENSELSKKTEEDGTLNNEINESPVKVVEIEKINSLNEYKVEDSSSFEFDTAKTELTLEEISMDETTDLLPNGDGDEDKFVNNENEGLEEGEIKDVDNDDLNEDEEEVNKNEMAKQFFKYTKEELLGLSKNVKPLLINDVPKEVVKDKNSSNNNTSPLNNSNFNRSNQQLGNRNIKPRNMMGIGGGWLGPILIPQPPPKQPPKIIEIMNFEKVELHKAENAWKPKRGNDTDINEQIVSQTTGILNKLTPDNFDKLVEKFLKLPLEDNDERISSVIRVVFEKSIDEPSFSAAYAKMVHTICKNSQETSKIFRKKILDQCQKEFQKTSTDETDIKEIEIAIEKTDDESKKQSLKEELDEKRTQMRRRSLGNVRFIGELYKLQMLTPRIMIDCVTMLLSLDEENLECLCKLLTTVGLKLEEQIKEVEFANENRRKGGQEVKFAPEPKWFDKTFNKLYDLSKVESLSSRIRFALLDVHELRQNNWKPRRDANAPKTIDEVRRDAIRQDQEEKRQINSLPMSTAQPQRRGDIKKQTDWNTVPSNKSSRFQNQIKQTDQHSGSHSPVFAPPKWGPPSQLQMSPSQSQSTFGGGKPPQTSIAPRYGSRFEALLDNEKKTPTRAEIVKSLPESNKNAQQNVFSIQKQPPLPQPPPSPSPRNPSPPTNEKNPISPSANDKSETREPSDLVKSIFDEYCFSKNLADTIEWTKERFKGDSINQFIEILSRQTAEASKEEKQIAAGVLVNGLISNKVVSKESVLKNLQEGVLLDLPDIEVDAPKAVSYLAVFLVEIFCDEKNLLWLPALGTSLQEENIETWTNLVVNIFNILKDKISKETVVHYSKEVSDLPTANIEWLKKNDSQDVVNKDLVNKIIPVLDENPNDILKALRELNISDDQYSSLIEAICVSSWDSNKKLWDIKKLTSLLPQLYEFINAPDSKLHIDIWDKFRNYFKQNNIDEEREDELWSIWNQQIKTTSSVETV